MICLTDHYRSQITFCYVILALPSLCSALGLAADVFVLSRGRGRNTILDSQITYANFQYQRPCGQSKNPLYWYWRMKPPIRFQLALTVIHNMMLLVRWRCDSESRKAFLRHNAIVFDRTNSEPAKMEAKTKACIHYKVSLFWLRFVPWSFCRKQACVGFLLWICRVTVAIRGLV
jgi:hypothetical protein